MANNDRNWRDDRQYDRSRRQGNPYPQQEQAGWQNTEFQNEARWQRQNMNTGNSGRSDRDDFYRHDEDWGNRRHTGGNNQQYGESGRNFRSGDNRIEQGTFDQYQNNNYEGANYGNYARPGYDYNTRELTDHQFGERGRTSFDNRGYSTGVGQQYNPGGRYGGYAGRESYNDVDQYRSSNNYGQNTQPAYSNPYSQGYRSNENPYASGPHSGKGPKGYQRSDDRIREDVSDRLRDDSHIDASDIEVTVEKGTVSLSGTVDSRRAKRHAEDILESVSGIRDIENRLRLKDENEGNSQNTEQKQSSANSNSQGERKTAKNS